MNSCATFSRRATVRCNSSPRSYFGSCAAFSSPMGKRELKLLDSTQHSDVKIRRMGAIVRERLRLEAEAREVEEAARIAAEAAAEAAALALANGNGCKKEDEEAEEV